MYVTAEYNYKKKTGWSKMDLTHRNHKEKPQETTGRQKQNHGQPTPDKSQSKGNKPGSDWKARDKLLQERQEQEKKDGCYIHTREMCDKVYVEWTKNKYAEMEKTNTDKHTHWTHKLKPRKDRLQQIKKAYASN